MSESDLENTCDPLLAAVEQAGRYLPAQGPIGVFVHHNTLHAFEHLPFEQAVTDAARLFGARPFMPEAWYRAQLAAGRIRADDLEWALAHAETPAAGPAYFLGGRVDARTLRLKRLIHGFVDGDACSIRWRLEEEGMVRRFVESADRSARLDSVTKSTQWLEDRLRAGVSAQNLFVDPLSARPPSELIRHWLGVEATLQGLQHALNIDPEACAVASLWAATARRVTGLATHREPKGAPSVRRLRDQLLLATGDDPDALAHSVFIPAVSAFLDQGVAYWPMTDREQGFYRSFRGLVLDGPGLGIPILAQARTFLAEQERAGFDAYGAVHESLVALGVEPSAWPEFLGQTARVLPGWAGIMQKLAFEPELAPHHCPPCSLLDFLAVRLLLDRAAVSIVARDRLGYRGSLAALASNLGSTAARHACSAGDLSDERWGLTFAMFQLAQLLGIATPDMIDLSDDEVGALVVELREFDDVARQQAWHLAYERRYRTETLSGLASHRVGAAVDRQRLPIPRLQVAFCLDEREESIRRHLEEQAPDVETFGVAGFFGVAIAYRGIDDGYHAPLCPVAVRPQHEIAERCADGDMRRYAGRRKSWAVASRGVFVGSRSLMRGWLATLGLGLFSLVPLTVRVPFPRLVKRIERRLHEWFFPRPQTQLTLQREAEEHGSLQLFPGFTPEEMAERVGRVLEDMGLVRGFSPLVAMVGHGSSSLNNPHESAHDCGACGGRRGGPNARLFALMANDPQVRALLHDRGLSIPTETFFLGGYHDTCNDAVEYFDLDRLPASHHPYFERLRTLMDGARTLSAHERCRRFDSVSLDVAPKAALVHVEGRAENLAEPRPEYGHATNAMCIFGRRGLTRGLFLDRRAFLVSYDPTTDEDGEIIGRLLATMGPVGAGINLEYYFSFVDNEVYGCGTKLPHNVTGLIGVMNGTMSDLRTGLPWQMVEIHEPVRLLVIVEGTPEIIAKVAKQYPAVGALVANRWIQLALIDPRTGSVTEFDRGSFLPVSATSSPIVRIERSIDWYRGRREHLPMAAVTGVRPSLGSAP